jgi:hypothetical protein
MIWLRHELWEYTDGLGYRLASRNATDDTGAPLRGGTLKQIFYAPSPAAAKAQYWALRQLGPIIPSRFESDAPFTLAQLQAQLAQYPDDATLHGQPALHPVEETATAPEVAADSGEAAEHGPLESLEPWPVVAHSEPTPDGEAPEAEALGEGGTVAADAPEEAADEKEPVSNVVPIRRPTPQDIRVVSNTNAEPQIERQPVAAPGALGLALAELGPAAAASGALALALAELEPTPNSMPVDGHPTTGQAPLSLVASQSTSTSEEPPVSETLVAEEPVAAPQAAEAEISTPHAETVEAVSTEPTTAEPLIADHAVAQPSVVEPLVVEPVAAEAEVAEPLAPEPIAAEKAVEPDPLGPITVVAGAATIAARGQRRKSGFFTGLFRVLMLLLILGGVILGVGLATGTFDGPTLLAQAQALPEQARALPDQIRNLSIVKTLLPG